MRQLRQPGGKLTAQLEENQSISVTVTMLSMNVWSSFVD